MYLSCGDTLYDLFVGPGSAGPSSVSLTGDVGGSPLNVATGLARLGHHSRFLTKLSSDLYGRRMRAKLESDGLDLSTCIDTDRNTTLAIIEKNSDGSARYVFYTDGTADCSLTVEELPKVLPDDVRVLHFGSYSTAIEPTATALHALAARESGRRLVSYDPNLRTMVVPDMEVWHARFNAFASVASLVKASDEDIESLHGAGAEERFVADCFARGAGLVFVTRGVNGGSGYAPDGRSTHAPGVKVDVVDTVGAGDTFQAVLLHWLGAHGHVGDDGAVAGEVDLEACLSLALKAAAITCSRAGADLPTLAEVSAA